MHSGYNDIWCEILQIIDKGFPEEGLNKLEYYAERFNEGKILYKRFSPQEQHGCRKGGVNHVIASLLGEQKLQQVKAQKEASTISKKNANMLRTRLKQ